MNMYGHAGDIEAARGMSARTTCESSRAPHLGAQARRANTNDVKDTHHPVLEELRQEYEIATGMPSPLPLMNQVRGGLVVSALIYRCHSLLHVS